MKLSELMNRIFEEPSSYLEKGSVSLMETYVKGFAAGRRIRNMQLEAPIYYGFHDWLANRFGFGSSQSWSSIISFMGISEANAFELAKKLWEEYKKEYQKALQQDETEN